MSSAVGAAYLGPDYTLYGVRVPELMGPQSLIPTGYSTLHHVTATFWARNWDYLAGPGTTITFTAFLVLTPGLLPHRNSSCLKQEVILCRNKGGIHQAHVHHTCELRIGHGSIPLVF